MGSGSRTMVQHTAATFLVGFWLTLGGVVVGAEAQSNPERGDVELNSRTNLQGNARLGGRASRSGAGGPARPASSRYQSGGNWSSDTGLRLAGQLRFGAQNVLPGLSGAIGAGGGYTHLLTGGVRLMDGKLFVGTGFGFASESRGDENSVSQFGLSIAPTATYDIVSAENVALYLGGMLNIGFLGDSSDGENDGDDGSTGIGLNLLGGLRAQLTDAFAVGAEAGWGFMWVSADNDAGDGFFHSVLGMLVLEVSMGL